MSPSYLRLKKNAAIFFSSLLLLTVSACSTFPKDDIEFTSATAPGVDLSSYKTFTWLAGATIVQDPHGYWKPGKLDAGAEAKFAINQSLRAKGFIETMNQPDFLVLYASGVDMEALEFEKDTDLGKDIMHNIPKGSLSVVLIDVRNQRPVWLGAAQGNIQQETHEDIATKRIHYAINEMLKDIPDAK